jgi:hypothetical protein
MFVICPITFDLIDANWYESVDDAKEDALAWSAELNGESVKVYEAIVENRAYTFNPLCVIQA